MQKIGISLGMNYEAFNWGVNNKLIEQNVNGYKTCPFDKMYSNYPGIIECLNDDFKFFCDINYLSIIYTSEGYLIYNSKYKFAFNKESFDNNNILWSENIDHFIIINYDNFLKIYSNRINAFREYLLDPKNKIEFIIQRYNTFKIDLWELKNVLSKHYPNLKYNFNVLFIDNENARNILKILQLDSNHPEMDRLNYWLDSPSCNPENLEFYEYNIIHSNPHIINKINIIEEKIEKIITLLTKINPSLKDFECQTDNEKIVNDKNFQDLLV